MTARAHRVLVIIAAVIVATALYANVLAGNDLERLEHRVTELESTMAVQTNAMDSLAGSVERAHAACVEQERCVAVLP